MAQYHYFTCNVCIQVPWLNTTISHAMCASWSRTVGLYARRSRPHTRDFACEQDGLTTEKLLLEFSMQINSLPKPFFVQVEDID